jgi:hypothetical protein
MAVLTGNAADIYIVSGTGTTMTGEAVTSLGGGVYQITNTAKRAIDPNSTLTVLDGVSTIPPANYQVSWGAGKITLTNGYSLGGTMTVTGKYLTVSQAAQGTDWSMDVEVMLEESQTFGDAWKERTAVMRGATVTFAQFYNDGYFYTNSGTYFILYLYANLSGGTRWMAAAQMANAGITTGENELIKQNVQFAIHGPVDYSAS